MANMPDINKRLVTMRVNIKTCIQVEKKYRQKDDASMSLCFIRALEDATRDCILSAEDYQKIADEVRENALTRRTIRTRS